MGGRALFPPRSHPCSHPGGRRRRLAHKLCVDSGDTSSVLASAALDHTRAVQSAEVPQHPPSPNTGRRCLELRTNSEACPALRLQSPGERAHAQLQPRRPLQGQSSRLPPRRGRDRSAPEGVVGGGGLVITALRPPVGCVGLPYDPSDLRTRAGHRTIWPRSATGNLARGYSDLACAGPRPGRYGSPMAIGAVHLRGGPCDGERPEPAPGTTFPEELDTITVMNHSVGVGHEYRVTADLLIDDDGVRRTVCDFRRSVERGS